MLKQTILRFAALWGVCLAAALFLLNPPGGVMGLLAYSLAGAFFFYAFSWVKEPLKWLMAFTGKYGFLAILFGSLPAILIVAVIFVTGLPILCMAGMALGAIRLAYNIWYAVSLDRQGILPDGNDTLKMP